MQRVLRKSQFQILFRPAPNLPCCRDCNALTSIRPLAADKNGNAASGLSGRSEVAVGAALQANCGWRMSAVRHRTQSSCPSDMAMELAEPGTGRWWPAVVLGHFLTIRSTLRPSRLPDTSTVSKVCCDSGASSYHASTAIACSRGVRLKHASLRSKEGACRPTGVLGEEEQASVGVVKRDSIVGP